MSIDENLKTTKTELSGQGTESPVFRRMIEIVRTTCTRSGFIRGNSDLIFGETDAM